MILSLLRFRFSSLVFFVSLLFFLPGTRAFAQDDGVSEPIISEEIRSLIDGGLEWLALQQERSGAWSTGAPGGTQYRGAMTGYVLLSYMGSGHLPREGPYGESLQRAVDYLVGIVLPDGTIQTDNRGHYMYSHGVVLLALTQVLGQTGDADIRPAIERMVGLTLGAQDGNGGWRYHPRPSGADISATVVQVVALRAARDVGIPIAQEVFDRAADYVRACNIEGTSGFAYMPKLDRPGYARTAAAAYSLQTLGHYDDPLVAPAIEELLNTRIRGNQNLGRWITYGDYYATPAMYMVGGEAWAEWYAGLSVKIAADAIRDGDRVYWGNPRGGGSGDNSPIYKTAQHISMLSVPTRFLPIYQR
jgi:hypothetical protein